ncbi:hypothetical protein [Streptomyces sp. SDr-06]|uniref:hypothetical protein n=1 Tax=Streptomyces sp. SDr-06 TaxID=2267702 RepID=UPI000DEBF46B|nr:hypothetical protein [Streptomyces sp. SDr-06]RCH66421.1 hypothetical protein DT019_22270 [Streptomyces sp. SDr-06]
MAALGALLAAPGPVQAAGQPPAYRFPEGVQDVSGGATSADGPVLKAGAAYRSVIRPGGKLYFRLVLDGENDAYASAVALPGPTGAKLAYGDSLKVSLQNADGDDCDSQRRSIGSAQYPHPIAAYAYRGVRRSLSTCQKPGTYSMVVERESDPTSTRSDWGLDLRYTTEPTRNGSGPSTAPSGWPSASPPPPTGTARGAHGGTGFHDAPALADGRWSDTIRPGETLFYRVPLDWGQQLFARGGLGSLPAAKDGYVGTALSLQLYNPARGFVSGASAPYEGKQREAALDPVAPVAYENRYSTTDEVSAMRVSGPYYLAVSLSPEVGQTFGDEPYDLTLGLTVRGAARSGPEYAGRAPDFGAGGSSAGDSSMKLLAALGIGTGTVLVAGLGVWTLVARRRAAAAPGPQGFGPPNAW